MADLSGLLTQKLGPFPGWVWALGVGGVVFLVGPKLLKGGSAAAASQPGAFDPQSFESGFAQGANYNITGPQGPPGQAGPAGADAGQATDATGPQPGLRWPIAPVRNPVGVSSPLRGQPVRYGTGGPARNRSASVGSLSADPHAYFHPAVKLVPQFGHFVRAGVGGATGGAPIAHAAAVHQLAHQAEIHPARLHMLNPRPHRFVRVA